MSLPQAPKLSASDLPSLAVGVFLLILAALLTYDAWHLRQPMTDVGIGPATFPYLVAAGLAVLAVLTFRSALNRSGVNFGIPNPGPLLFIGAGMACQIFLLNLAGFTIATGLMFALCARAFGRRSFLLLLPVGLVAAFIAYLGFRFGLQLNLPEGPLERLL